MPSLSLVILSVAKNLALPLGVNSAKHLLFLFENNQKQILRYAQNDMDRGFFNGLLIDS